MPQRIGSRLTSEAGLQEDLEALFISLVVNFVSRLRCYQHRWRRIIFWRDGGLVKWILSWRFFVVTSVMKKSLLLLLVASSAFAGLVPWIGGGGYERNDYQWELGNDGRPDELYLNGVLIDSSAGGEYDLGWEAVDCRGVRIGLIDSGDSHGYFNWGLVTGGGSVYSLCSNAVVEFAGTGFQPNPLDWVVGDTMLKMAAHGCRVINLPWGESSFSPSFSNAVAALCRSNVVLCCSVPDVSESVDLAADYPAGFGRWLWNVVPVASADRTGALNASAWGTNVIAAPGRNVISAVYTGGVYYASGTSFAVTHMTAVLAAVMARNPSQSSLACVNLIRAGLVAGDARVLGNLKLPGQELARPVLSVSNGSVVVNGIPGWKYELQRSTNLTDWTTGSVSGPVIFYRARG